MSKYTDNLPTQKKIGAMIRRLNIGVGRKSHGIYKYKFDKTKLDTLCQNL